jgi:hypothetical protein
VTVDSWIGALPMGVVMGYFRGGQALRAARTALCMALDAAS